MRYSLRTKLSLSYLLVAFLIVGFISFLSNVMLDRQFQAYVKKNIAESKQEIVSAITKQYETDMKWKATFIEDIGIAAIGKGLIIRLEDEDRQVVWDAMVHNQGMCQKILKEMADNMNSRYPGNKGSYVEVPYSIQYSDEEVGKVYLGYYGPFYLNDNDLEFINTLNRLLVGAGLFSMLLALIIGTVIAKRISTPIIRVTQTTQSISKGFFHDRINSTSNTKEIGELTKSVNQLAHILETQESLRKRLTGDVAHELRTPIATLQSHMEAMIDGVWEPDVKRLESCNEEIMRIGRMVGDLEKLAQFERETLVLLKERFELSSVIQRIIYNLENEFKNKQVQIHYTEKEVFIVADQDKLSQVLVNLISNALKYTPEGGSVEVGVKEVGDHIVLEIQDTGLGIPEVDLPFIFERFYRSDQSRNRLTGGSGIGLTIVKAIVEAHKGSIVVESKLGLGTRVAVSLPRIN